MTKKSKKLKKLKQQHYHSVETDYSLENSEAIKAVKKALRTKRTTAIVWGASTVINAINIAITYAYSLPKSSKILPVTLFMISLMATGVSFYNFRKFKQCFNEYLR